LSPEAEAARAVFHHLKPSLARVIDECTSGRELHELGYPEDVAVSSEFDVSEVVPVLEGGVYRRLLGEGI
jgi:2-phosphosulfolactate phosphatase